MKATLHLKLTAKDTELREMAKDVVAKALIGEIDKGMKMLEPEHVMSILQLLSSLQQQQQQQQQQHAAKADSGQQPVKLCFVLIAGAGLTGPLASQLTPAWLQRCATALNTQLQRDVSSYWPMAMRAFVRVASSPTDIGPGEIAFAILPSLPDAPGAIAYHDVGGNAVPTAFLGLDTCSSLDDVSIAISHEVVETVGDSECDLWVDDGQGNEWAAELCDAVESNSYGIDLGDGQPPIRVSDFLFQTFFAPSAPAPYNFLGAGPNVLTPSVAGSPSAPFTTASGGYQIKRSSGGGETQVTGKINSRNLKKKMHWGSRTARRGVLPKDIQKAAV